MAKHPHWTDREGAKSPIPPVPKQTELERLFEEHKAYTDAQHLALMAQLAVLTETIRLLERKVNPPPVSLLGRFLEPGPTQRSSQRDMFITSDHQRQMSVGQQINHAWGEAVQRVRNT